ncbi:MAG TPA: CaiB/BaiF CoA-transferase family protein [Polyangia bacterium]|nr:CaiB/BaiF CoA-transferase family protein [Polyangia bacterium]
MARPLDGVRVLDLSRLLPGPFATLILSDLGADVVKVEDTGAGDYLRAFPPFVPGTHLGGRFAAINRDKRSIAIDLKQPSAVAAFRRLAAQADVVVESFRPGVIDKLGIGFEVLAAQHPGIIVCSISGYGQTGPYRDRAGHDLNYIGLGGVLAMTGPAGGGPQMPGVQIADLAGGGLWAAVGICAALAARTKTGRGQYLDVSMTEGSLAFLIAELGNMVIGGPPPRRGQELLNGALACYGVYETRDGRYLSVGALEPKFWLAFNQTIGRSGDLSELVGGPDVQARVRAQVAAILRTKTRAEWEEIFARADAMCEPVLETDELLGHPLHQARRMFFEIAGLPQMRTPLGAPEARRPPPTQGQHTDEVLREAGFSEADIAALRATGAIR